jgi:hypothetical protein
MSTRIPAAWLVVLVVAAVFAFFGYHIVQVVSAEETKPVQRARHMMPTLDIQEQEEQEQEEHDHGKHSVPPFLPPLRQPNSDKPPSYLRNIPQEHGEDESQAPASARPSPAPKRMPTVPAQTEEDLRASEPLQATPPTTQYDLPEAIDPMNRMVHSDAEFGTNFRHPEQMIERRPAAGMAGVIPSGLGSAGSRPGGNNPQMYAPEMAQNGGEFMSGIHAFDMSEAGVGYSMI